MKMMGSAARERLWNGNYSRVMLANFTLFFAFYLLTPLLPLYLVENFSATKDVVGVVLSGYTLTALLCRPLSGYLVDSYDRKRVLLGFFALFTVCFGGYLLASSLLAFTIVRTLHGAPFGGVTVANSTAAVDSLPSSRRNEGIGYYGLSNNLAMAVAPSVGIFIYKWSHSFELLFWLALAIALLGFVTDSTLRYEKKSGRGSRELQPPANTYHPSPVKHRLLDRFFLLSGWLIAVNMVFYGLCFGVLSNYLAIYSRDAMGVTEGTGTYFALLSVGLIASRLQGAEALRKGRLTLNAAEGTVLSAAGYLLFAASPNLLGYYGSALLIGLGNGHIWPAFQNMMLSVARHNQRGTANSTLLVSWDVGMGLGVLLGGFVAEHLGYSAAFWTVAAVQMAGTVMFISSTRQFYNKRKIND